MLLIYKYILYINFIWVKAFSFRVNKFKHIFIILVFQGGKKIIGKVANETCHFTYHWNGFFILVL